MKRAYLVDDVRNAEKPLMDAGVPLMEKAAFALANTVFRYLRRRSRPIPGSSVLVLAGAGNNGGDALFAAAELLRRGVQVYVVYANHAHSSGLEAACRAGARIIHHPSSNDVYRLGQKCDVWIDALLGIGARGALRAPYDQWVLALNALHRVEKNTRHYVIAVDVPSGVGVDDGTRGLCSPQAASETLSAGVRSGAKTENAAVLRADVTVTMGAGKPALYLPPACYCAGTIIEIPLGFEPYLSKPAVMSLEDRDVRALWVLPGHEDHKYTRGVLGMVAGSRRYPGAGVLSAGGALATGVGMIRYIGFSGAVIRAYPDLVHEPGRVQAWVLGSGLDSMSEAEVILNRAVEESLPVVLDAGALSLVYEKNVPESVILTPHEGEMASLLQARGENVVRSDIHAYPAWAARKCAELTGATVVLKGAATIIAPPQGTLYVQGGAPGWLATAGAGDVLGGIMGAVVAMHGDAISEGSCSEEFIAQLASAACYIHAQAARYASGLSSVVEKYSAALPGGAGKADSAISYAGTTTSVGRPITASALIEAVPHVVGAILNSEVFHD